MQVINLYANELKPKLFLISFNSLMMVSISLVVFFLLLSLYSSYSIDKYFESVENIENIQIGKQKNILTLTKSIDLDYTSSGEVDALINELAIKEDWANVLKKLNNSTGYSLTKILHDISISMNKNMYIEAFSVFDNYQSIEIKGRSKEVYYITQYLDSLRVKNNTDFKGLNLLKAEKTDNSDYRFLIGNDNDK